jgi:hypothetical protein
VHAPTGAPENASAAQGAASLADAAPIVEVPRRNTRTDRRKQGFRALDVVVAIVALIVIGLSLLGLSWLFRTQ